MTAGNRKHPYRLNTEYDDQRRRQQKHEQNRYVWVFIIFSILFTITMVYLGVRLS